MGRSLPASRRDDRFPTRLKCRLVTMNHSQKIIFTSLGAVLPGSGWKSARGSRAVRSRCWIVLVPFSRKCGKLTLNGHTKRGGCLAPVAFSAGADGGVAELLARWFGTSQRAVFLSAFPQTLPWSSGECCPSFSTWCLAYGRPCGFSPYIQLLTGT